jgi:hypothetical protein
MSDSSPTGDLVSAAAAVPEAVLPAAGLPAVGLPVAGLPVDAAKLLRVSDAERELVVKHLSAACAEGRLTLEEMGGRVGSAYSAVTRADLEPLTVDLPAPGAPASAPAIATPAQAPVKTKRKWLVTVMGELKRGVPRLPDRTVVVTVMGESKIDLRNALIESPEIRLDMYLMMGEQQIIVPEGVEVEVTGFVFMGEKRVEVVATRPRPGVPRLHIRVIGMMGEIKIRTA